LVREGKLHPHRGRQTESHGPKPAGIDPAAGLIECVKLRGPHLMLADIRGDIRITLGCMVELFDHMLGFNGLAFTIITEAIDGLPLLDALPPGL
jgi:hypothetical protein